MAWPITPASRTGLNWPGMAWTQATSTNRILKTLPGTANASFPKRFAQSCGVLSLRISWLTSHPPPPGLIGDIYANVLEHELPALLNDIRLHTNRQVYYQLDRTLPNSVGTLLRFCIDSIIRRFGRGRRGVQNLPDLTPVDFHAREHVNSVTGEVKVDTTDVVMECLPEASRRLNIPTVCTILHSILKWARLCSQTEVGHFENLL
jgi:hypothetical protein